MPISFGLERSHLYCTRVHNSGLQTPTSSMCKSTTHTCMGQEDTRALACTRQETRASHLHASKRCASHSPLRPRSKMCVPIGARRDARILLLLASQKCAYLGSYRDRDPV